MFCKSDISILISMRHWQQSCSAMDIFTLFLIPQMHIYSHGLQLRSPAGSCNRHNKNLFGSAIRQLLLLSKYPQIYLKRYPKSTPALFPSRILQLRSSYRMYWQHTCSGVNTSVFPPYTANAPLRHPFIP